MNPSSFKCPSCNDFETTNLNSLRIHCQKKHALSTRTLYTLLFLPDGKEPTCGCGCGEPTKFIRLQDGFSKYVLGHAARVNNNWGHNKIAQENSLKKRRDEGLWSKNPWNRGKTKENDEEFSKIVDRAYNTPIEKIRRSDAMKNQWTNKTLLPLKGSSHPHWKGGTSALQPLVRSHLHRIWVYPKLREGGFKCSKCESTKDLEVHHDGERFASILHKAILALGEPEDDFEKKSLIAEWVTNYHVEKNVTGVVLCEGCHGKEHD